MRTKTYPKIKFREFDLLPEKNYTNLTSIFKNGYVSWRVYYGFTGFEDFLKKHIQIFKKKHFVTDFNQLYLEDYLELSKNKICFGYLLFVKRLFPGSFRLEYNGPIV